MIVQYLSEYIAATEGDAQKIAEFEERYGYTPKPFLRDGLQDARYYKLSNFYADEHSRYTAAVRLLAVVVHESKVAPPRGKQREVIKQWLLWLSRREEFSSIEDLQDLCRKETAIDKAETINSIINQTSELRDWRNARSVVVETHSNLDSISTPVDEDTSKMTDAELLEKLKNHESFRTANSKDRRAIKKAFAKMTYEERVLYFALD